ncbi:transcription elongation factor spt6 [Lasallia pustulata]|uniref:Transcription elongation factor Spt6 n=1 Tax=Lasallia pustulata TaxID=136370 RepID=A0A1W5CS17_9LECA|nr:transcription elongation factor spt6 [Lasallia pustulata]
MSARDLIEGEAELDDEEGDESFDEETGEVTRKTNGVNGHIDDSSEEEDDDDDEEAARAVREGFIVEDEEEPEERARRRREKKKRRREEREEEEAGLDEEDLDLIGEANPDFERRAPSEPKLKRLKRGHKDDRDGRTPRGVGDIFDSDEEEDTAGDFETRRPSHRAEGRKLEDEFADFIEEDFSGDEGRDQHDDDEEVARTVRRGYVGVKDAAGLDETALEDMKEAFGDGTEYDWALDLQEQEDQEDRHADSDDPERSGLAKAIELKDVFEPSQLAERMLTDEDNLIRMTDEPERFQIARKPYKHLVLTDEQFKEESIWISNLMLPKKRLEPDLRDPFQKAVAKVLEFMITDEYEVPFIFQHRKDYLIHAAKVAVTPDYNNPSAPQYVVSAEKLLNQSDLWDIFDLDLKFRALVDKRNVLQRTYDNLVSISNVHDDVFEEMLPAAVSMEELQDVQDYLHFQHSSQLKDLTLVNGTESHATQRRPGASKLIFERIRNGKVYNLVRAFGITADAFAQNALKREGRRQYTEDPSERPDDMADSDSILDPPDYSSGAQCLRAAKAVFAEELAMSPKMRKVMRQTYYMDGVIECFRTDKGLRKIDEQHPYYEFKYLRNQQLSDIARQPDLFLRMLKAEEEGLVEVKVRLQGYDRFKQKLYSDLESDNFSEVADAWNRERREALDMALVKLDKIMARGVKENMKAECENQVAKSCREEFLKKLDQAPYKPKGMILGTVPRVLALSNGSGIFGRESINWAWVEEDGRVLENGKFLDLSVGDQERGTEDGADVRAFVELVERRKPDVIGVSGFSADTRKLYKQLEDLVEQKNLRGAEYEDEDGNERSDKLEVVTVNDEVARLYQTSDRANIEHPGFAPLTKYAVGLAKYLQNPMKEYASLGKDIVSISFDPSQQLLPQEKILKQLETALVDMVNLCGVDINEAVSDMYTANLLPYVCGLGPRKASQLLKAININGGVVSTRAELVGDPEQHKLAAVGPRVWNNCASFLYIEFDSTEPESDYLDNTRVHPEDYDLGRKMAADALELDEEDIQAETSENGPGAIVRKLIKDDAQEKVNDLILEEYAEQLEKNFNQRKRATLETIRAELQQPYEELRRNFALLTTDEIFTMFTGETRDSLCEGMIVPVSIKRVQDEVVEARLDCGIEGTVPGHEISERLDVSAKQLYAIHQTVQAKIIYLNRKSLSASLSLQERQLRTPYRKEIDRLRDEWDEVQEQNDKELMKEKNDVSGRTQRVIKHPLFKSFNAAQAEEYLGSQARGDVVIRPSSKGLDHLAVTWKVSDNVYQHIDVLEMNKENDYSAGKLLKIGRHTYSDLDELIVNHVKAMARKVDEMMLHEKFQNGSKADTERWLTTYTEANPKRSVYNFCVNPKYPGYFYLCFKAGQHAQVQNWAVKVVPNAFELQKNMYPDMRALCNGFKLLFTNMQSGKRR